MATQDIKKYLEYQERFRTLLRSLTSLSKM